MSEYNWKSYGTSITVPLPENRRWKTRWWQFWRPKKPLLFLLEEEMARSELWLRDELAKGIFSA